jgi:hypothetical protein
MFAGQAPLPSANLSKRVGASGFILAPTRYLLTYVEACFMKMF